MICPSCECEDVEHVPDSTTKDLSWCSYCGGGCSGIAQDKIELFPKLQPKKYPRAS